MSKANIKYWNGSKWIDTVIRTTSDAVADKTKNDRSLTESLEKLADDITSARTSSIGHTDTELALAKKDLGDKIEDLKNAVADIGLYEIVTTSLETIPPSTIKTNKIYLLKDSTAAEDSKNKYFEYAYINNTWELMGSTTLEEAGGSVVTSRFNIMNGEGLGSIQQKSWKKLNPDDPDGTEQEVIGGTAEGDNSVAFNKDTFAYQNSSAAFGGGSKAGLSEAEFNELYTITIDDLGTRIPKYISDLSPTISYNLGLGKVPGTNNYIVASYSKPNATGESYIYTTSTGASRTILKGELNKFNAVEPRQGYPYALSWSFAFATGEVNEALGRGSFAANYHNTVKGEFAAAFGHDQEISENGKHGFASGQDNKVHAKAGFAANAGNVVNHQFAALFGEQNKSGSTNQTIVGQFNRYDKFNPGSWDCIQEGDSPTIKGTGYSMVPFSNPSANPKNYTIFDASAPDDPGDANVAFGVGTAELDGARHTAFRVFKDSTIEHRVRYAKNSSANTLRKKVFKTDTDGRIKIYEEPVESLNPIRKKEFDKLNNDLVSARLTSTNNGRTIVLTTTNRSGTTNNTQFDLVNFTHSKAFIDAELLKISTNASDALTKANTLEQSVKTNASDIAINTDNIETLNTNHSALIRRVDILEKNSSGNSGGTVVAMTGSEIAGAINLKNGLRLVEEGTGDNKTFFIDLNKDYKDYLDDKLYDAPYIYDFSVLSGNVYEVGTAVTVSRIYKYSVMYNSNVKPGSTLTLTRSANTTVLGDGDTNKIWNVENTAGGSNIGLTTSETLIPTAAGKVTFTLEGTNSRNATFSATNDIYFRLPYFYGIKKTNTDGTINTSMSNYTKATNANGSVDLVNFNAVSSFNFSCSTGEDGGKLLFFFPQQINTIFSGGFEVSITERSQKTVTITSENNTITADYWVYETEELDPNVNLDLTVNIR